MYFFEESPAIFWGRCGSLGIGIEKSIENGTVELRRVDASRVTLGQFIHDISTSIEQNHTGMVIIDRLNGYLQTMSSDRSFVLHLHELLAYLNAKGGDYNFGVRATWVCKCGSIQF